MLQRQDFPSAAAQHMLVLQKLFPQQCNQGQRKQLIWPHRILLQRTAMSVVVSFNVFLLKSFRRATVDFHLKFIYHRKYCQLKCHTSFYKEKITVCNIKGQSNVYTRQ